MSVPSDARGEPERSATADSSASWFAEDLPGLLQRSLEVHPDGVYWMDTANRFIYVNQAACDALGYTRDELLGMPLVAVNAGATPEAMARVWEQLRSVGSYCRESVHRRKDGSLFPVEIMATYVRVDDREYNCGYARDISARRRAEESLRESEERYRALADALPQVVFETDRSGRLTYANRIAFEVFGYSTDELEGGLYAVDMVDPTEQERVSSGIECVLAGSPRSQGSEYLGRRKDGSTFPVAIYSTPLLREGEVMGIRGIIIDMTKARQAEAEHARLRTQLFQAQRAEAVGALAGGIAHDFNNLLAAILMQLEMLPLEHDLTPGMVASVREIRESADRAAALTHQLLTFSRRQPIRRSAFDLNMVIAELLKMLQRVIGESIAVSFEPCPTPASVLADAGMMEQVVMNLCVNARDAMPQGGMLRLALAQVTLDGAVLSGHPQSRAGQFIRLEVSDTGCGMDAGTLARLFEPFFTTKGVGQGTGLGLATTHSIVAQHEGWIEVTSEAGRGATFRVWLPQHDAEPVQAATALDDGARGGAAVVLLVEDEEAVRGSTARGLRRMGYEVVEAGDGVEALGVWEREAGRVDLLLTDMVMPAGLNGVELSRRLREQRADLPVVIASGYMAEDRTLPESVTFLSKPFTLAQLGAAVRGALGTTGQGPDEREARRG